jgi:hypothetical protein
LHEIAHAIAGYHEHHGVRWQKISREIGCSGEIHGVKISENYLAICENCGYHHTRTQLAYNNKFSCSFCCEKYSAGQYDSKFRLNYKIYES